MIGIFDSGIGGLTVARAFMHQLPGYDFLYFGDTARTPYGTKSPGTVIEYALQDTEFLIRKGAKVVVMACNTASSVATERVADAFQIPIFDVIAPAVETSLAVSRSGRIGVIGTRATVNSGVYQRKIQAAKPDAKVYAAACPLLVPLVEEGWLRKPVTAMIVKRYLHPLKVRQIDTLILGCTHYPLLAGMIQRKIGKRVAVIDSSVGVAAAVKSFLEQHTEIDGKMSRTGETRLFVSDITSQFEKVARSTLKERLPLKLVKL